MWLVGSYCPQFKIDNAVLQVVPKDVDEFVYEKVEKATARSNRVTAGTTENKYA
jgi:hypothetical protein